MYAVLNAANTVVEIANPPAGFDVTPFLNSGLWVEAESVTVGMTYDPASNAWSNAVSVSATPPNVTMIGPLELIQRFTPVEYAAICEAAMGNVVLFQFLVQTVAANYLVLTDPSVVAGVQMLANVGLISADRVSTILSTGA